MPSSLHLQVHTPAATNRPKQPPTCPFGMDEAVARLHTRPLAPDQCCSVSVQAVDAPVHVVWSLVRRFDDPQAYKRFVKSCRVVAGDGGVGTLREVRVVSGLPAASSVERLEILDEERHVMGFGIVGGVHRLENYRSVTSVHASAGGKGTVVVESYAVDVPAGNTGEETRVFVDTIVRCNLLSLARIAEKMARNDTISCRSDSVSVVS